MEQLFVIAQLNFEEKIKINCILLQMPQCETCVRFEKDRPSQNTARFGRNKDGSFFRIKLGPSKGHCSSNNKEVAGDDKSCNRYNLKKEKE